MYYFNLKLFKCWQKNLISKIKLKLRFVNDLINKNTHGQFIKKKS